MLATMNTDILILILLITVIAGFVHGSVGFGFPMVATPLLSIFIDLQTAIVLTLTPTLIMNIAAIVSEGRTASAFYRYFPLAFSAMVGSAVGTQTLIFTHSDIFKVVLALVIILYLCAENIHLRIPLVDSNPSFARYAVGFVAGVLGGLTNVMAPVLIVYSLQSEHTKTEIVQAANLCFLLGKIMQIVFFGRNGSITLSSLSVSGLMTVFACVAFIAGMRIRKNLAAGIYKKILKLFLFVIALMLLFQYFM